MDTDKVGFPGPNISLRTQRPLADVHCKVQHLHKIYYYGCGYFRKCFCYSLFYKAHSKHILSEIILATTE